MAEVLEFSDPSEYSKDLPIHMAVYAKNGVGKTTFVGTAAKSGMRITLLDCSDAGAITLRKHPKEFLKIIRIKNIHHYLDTMEHCIRHADEIDIVVADTLTGLQSLALKEVKGKRSFEMNQRKWGLVGSRVIECIAETRNFPKDVIYLVQEKTKHDEDSDTDEITVSLTPSIKGYLSSAVDWVGRMTIEAVEREATGGVEQVRYLDFRITEFIEAKDRASIFPKRIKNPAYPPIRKKIFTTLHDEGEQPKNG